MSIFLNYSIAVHARNAALRDALQAVQRAERLTATVADYLTANSADIDLSDSMATIRHELARLVIHLPKED